MKRIDLMGKTFGSLYVKDIGEPKRFPGGSSQPTWRCICICGKEILVCSGWLISGKKKSCGCKNFTGKNGNAKFHPQTTSWKALHNRCLQSAKTRKIEFKLTPEQVSVISSKSCTYCGLGPSLKFNVYCDADGKTRTSNIERCNEGWITHGTIDRIDSKVGYVANNVVSACFTCNTAKGIMTSAEFYNWIKRISKRWEQSELSVFQTHIHTTNQSLCLPETS